MSDNADKSLLFWNLYSDECVELLRQALELAEATVTSSKVSRPNGRLKSRYADSSTSEEENDSSSEQNSASLSASEEEESEEEGPRAVNDESGATPKPMMDKPKRKKRTKMELDERQRTLAAQKHFATLSCISLPLSMNNENRNSTDGTTANVLAIPSSLLSKEDRHHLVTGLGTNSFATTTTTTRTLLNLATAVQTQPVIVLSLRSGRFAGAVFVGKDCVTHTTSQRYTVRKGQGKAQSTQDGQRRPKSMGAQLRRAGELALQEDITATLKNWKDYLASAALILLSVPKTMLKTVWEAGVLHKGDARIRKVPLDVGRPTFENVCMMHAVVMTVQQRDDVPIGAAREQEEDRSAHHNDLPESNSEQRGRTGTGSDVRKGTPVVEPTFPKLSDLHIATRDGDVGSLKSILLAHNDNNGTKHPDINAAAGPDLLTPLHFAAQSTAENGVDAAVAAECVTLLLLSSVHAADPCVVDARNRPPYFLASHEKVREAFRIARATLGEDYCRWDEGAKVGPALTADDIQAKKDKEAEKRRKKKARQKEKKQKEKAQVEEAERSRKEEEERMMLEKEAKRVRDGLAPKHKASSGGVCDFCQTVCKGRKRSQMFQRLEYTYCSTECVQKHKRELMAAAAQKRLGCS